LSGGEATRGVGCFIVEDGRIVVLRRSDFQTELHGPVSFGLQVDAPGELERVEDPMTRKKLLKVSKSGLRGLYETTDSKAGKWVSWEWLETEKPIDPALRLQAESTPKPASIGGLYGGTDREGQRRREVNEALEKAGLRPPSRW
jgi:hypothetical protein